MFPGWPKEASERWFGWIAKEEQNRSPCSPDGKEIGFRSGPMGKFTMWRMPADRSAPSQQVLPASTMAQSLESWSPDGRNLVYTEMSLQSGSNVLILPPDGKPLRLGEPATRSTTASMAMAAGGMPPPV